MPAIARATIARPLGARVLGSVLVLALMVLNPAPGEEPVPAKGGRFVVLASPVRAFATLVMIDTATGECWKGGELADGEQLKIQWQSLKFPVKDTKVERGEIGRFRVSSFFEPVAGGRGCLLVTDTADGRSWFLRAGSEKWVAVPAPPLKK
ncbi:MAG TPA: hypothetical protein VGE74_19425 [Gemmata sp.]